MNVFRHILCVALLVGAAFAQSQNEPKPTFPVHPYVAGGLSLFEDAGAAAVGGVIVEAPHIFSYSEGGYETGGKTNDLVNTSHTGHTRYLRDQTLYRSGDWYFGPGVSWSKLYTPAYSKSSVHPFGTVGHAFPGYVDKVLVSYVAPGTDWQNGVQGFEAQGWWTSKHVFLRMLVGGYWAHTTVTNRSDPKLTAIQRSEHFATSQFQALLGWRF